MEADRPMHAAVRPAGRPARLSEKDGGCCGLKGSSGHGRGGGCGWYGGVCLCVCVRGHLGLPEGPLSPSLYYSFCFCLEIELGAEEEGSTRLGFPYPLTQVMVLHTGDYKGAKCWGCVQGRYPWRGGLIPAHCSLSVDKADSCN